LVAFFLSLITIPFPSVQRTKVVEVGVVEFGFHELRYGGREEVIKIHPHHVEDFLVGEFLNLPQEKIHVRVKRRGIRIEDEFGELFERVDIGEMGERWEKFLPQKVTKRVIQPGRVEFQFFPSYEIKERGGGLSEEGMGIGLDIKITGPASKRKILHREDFTLPEWVERQGVSMEGQLKFWVLPDGSIGRVGVEKTFGSLRDHHKLHSWLISVFRKWRFSPLVGDDRKEWGIITIKIKLD
jgi:hypothetical protein